jgi:hypothetical protein
MFAAGKTAFAHGDLATAKSLFQAVRARVPGHPSTDFYLAQIQLAEKENRGISLEQRLAAIEVSSLKLEDVTLEEAVEVVRKQVGELDNPALPANFVLLVPDEAKKTRFSLSLAGVPLTALLEYIASLTGSEVAYEKHAVVFREPGSGEGEDAKPDDSAPKPEEP